MQQKASDQMPEEQLGRTDGRIIEGRLVRCNEMLMLRCQKSDLDRQWQTGVAVVV